MEEKYIIILLFVSNFYFGWRYWVSQWQMKGIIFYSIEKGCTPPTKQELHECIRKCARCEFRRWRL